MRIEHHDGDLDVTANLKPGEEILLVGTVVDAHDLSNIVLRVGGATLHLNEPDLFEAAPLVQMYDEDGKPEFEESEPEPEKGLISRLLGGSEPDTES